MLDFLDLRAQSTKSLDYSVERKWTPTQHRASYVASANNTCVACKKGKHPLYTCQSSKLLPYERKETIVKGNGYCFNFLNKGAHMEGVPIVPMLSEMPDAPSYLAT